MMMNWHFSHFTSGSWKTTFQDNVYIKYTTLSSSHQITLCWLPSNVGVKGYKNADHSAKAALSLQPSNFVMVFSILITVLRFCSILIRQHGMMGYHMLYQSNQLQANGAVPWNDVLPHDLLIKPTSGKWCCTME